MGFSSTALAVRVTPGYLKNIHLFVSEENEGRKLCTTTLPITLSWLQTVLFCVCVCVCVCARARVHCDSGLVLWF